MLDFGVKNRMKEGTMLTEKKKNSSEDQNFVNLLMFICLAINLIWKFSGTGKVIGIVVPSFLVF